MIAGNLADSRCSGQSNWPEIIEVWYGKSLTDCWRQKKVPNRDRLSSCYCLLCSLKKKKVSLRLLAIKQLVQWDMSLYMHLCVCECLLGEWPCREHAWKQVRGEELFILTQCHHLWTLGHEARLQTKKTDREQRWRFEKEHTKQFEGWGVGVAMIAMYCSECSLFVCRNYIRAKGGHYISSDDNTAADVPFARSVRRLSCHGLEMGLWKLKFKLLIWTLFKGVPEA